MTAHTILALDLGSRATGWAVGASDQEPKSGVLSFAPGTPLARIFNLFDDWLEDRLSEHRPDFLYYEMPFVGPSMPTVRSLYGLLAFVLAAGERHRIVTRPAVISEIDLFFVGPRPRLIAKPGESKRALTQRRRVDKKARTIAAAAARGWLTDTPADVLDDAADALACWAWASHQVDPRKPSAETNEFRLW